MLDFATNLLTWLTQLFITNRVVSRFGLVVALLFLPAVSLVRVLGIALWPGLVVYVVFRCFAGWGICAVETGARGPCSRSSVARKSIKRRTSSIRPFRAGDASTGWLVSGIKALGVTTAQIAWALVPPHAAMGLAGIWDG